MDTFGEPVTLSYKGETKYTTSLGATITLIIYIIIAIYAGYLLYLFFMDVSTETQSDTIFLQLNDVDEITPFGTYDFDININVGGFIPA